MEELELQLSGTELEVISKRQSKQKEAKLAVQSNAENSRQLLRELLRLERQEKTLQKLIYSEQETVEQTIQLTVMIRHLLTEHERELLVKLTERYNIVFDQPEPIYSEEDVANRRAKLLTDEDNESQWTDQRSMGDDFDDILLVDDQIANAMEESEGSQGQEKQKEEGSEEDLEELEEEFVKVGGKSDHHKLLVGHSKFVVSLAVDRKNERLVSGAGDDLLNLYDLKQLSGEDPELKPIHSFKQEETVGFVRFSFNNEKLVAATDKYLSVYDCKSLEYKRVELDDCKSLAMHPLGSLCAAASGHEAHLYNLNNATLYSTFYSDREVTLVEFAPGGKHLVMGGKGQLRVVQPKTEETKRIFGHTFHQQEIVCVDFNENTVLSGSVDGYACLSNWTTGVTHGRTELHTNSVESVLFYNHLFLTGCVDGFVRWYDTNTLKKVNNYQFKGAITKMLRLQDSPLVAISTFEGELCCMDPRSHNEKKLFSAGSTIHDLTYFKQTLLAACEDGTIKAFDLTKL